MLRATIAVEVSAAVLVALGWLLWPSTTHREPDKTSADVAITLGGLLIVGVTVECLISMICSSAARMSAAIKACFYVAAGASLFILIFRPIA